MLLLLQPLLLLVPVEALVVEEAEQVKNIKI
jgi:hypothetical protein